MPDSAGISLIFILLIVLVLGLLNMIDNGFNARLQVTYEALNEANSKCVANDSTKVIYFSATRNELPSTAHVECNNGALFDITFKTE